MIRAPSMDEERRDVFRRVRDQIDRRLQAWLVEPAT